MTYLWRTPGNYPNRLMGMYQRRVSRDSYAFRHGKPAKETGERVDFVFECRLADLKGLGCVCNSTLIPLVSPRLADFLMREVGEDIQLIKARVIAKDGETDRYKLLNITRLVSCFDKDKSKMLYLPEGHMYGFEYLVHKPGCMGSSHLARDAGYLGHIIVSDELAAKMRALNMPGISLVRPEDVYP